MINRLIDPDEIPGEWYTPRKVDARPAPEPVCAIRKAAEIRDEHGWGLDEEDLTGGKLGTPAGATEQPEAPPEKTEKKPVFGKHRRRYSNRL
jgi:hypothetical protein